MKNIERHSKIIFILIAFFFFGLEFLTLKEIIIIPKFINLGFVQPTIYGLLLMLAVILVTLLFYINSRQIQALKKVKIEDLLLYAVVFGLPGARLYHVITDWHLYKDNPWGALQIWNGGIGLFGGLLGGLIGIYFYARKNKVQFLAIIDLLVIFLPLAQIVGRMGNLINQELYGFPTNLPWSWQISALNGSFHPTFLYEQIGNLLLFIILYGKFKKSRVKIKLGEGKLTLIYFGGYSVIRFIVEFFRTAPRSIFGWLTFDQLVCIGILSIVMILAFLSRKNTLATT